MITKFKIFESELRPTLKDPQPGDYVICTIERNKIFNDEKLDIFLQNNIGKIRYFYQGNPYYYYVIDYNDVKVDFDITYSRLRKYGENYQYLCQIEQILDWSKDINDIHMKLDAKKYNL